MIVHIYWGWKKEFSLLTRVQGTQRHPQCRGIPVHSSGRWGRCCRPEPVTSESCSSYTSSQNCQPINWPGSQYFWLTPWGLYKIGNKIKTKHVLKLAQGPKVTEWALLMRWLYLHGTVSQFLEILLWCHITLYLQMLISIKGANNYYLELWHMSKLCTINTTKTMTRKIPFPCQVLKQSQ